MKLPYVKVPKCLPKCAGSFVIGGNFDAIRTVGL